MSRDLPWSEAASRHGYFTSLSRDLPQGAAAPLEGHATSLKCVLPWRVVASGITLHYCHVTYHGVLPLHMRIMCYVTSLSRDLPWSVAAPNEGHVTSLSRDLLWSVAAPHEGHVTSLSRDLLWSVAAPCESHATSLSRDLHGVSQLHVKVAYVTVAWPTMERCSSKWK